MNNKLAGDRFAELLDAMAELRGEHGCPWDKEQSHRSLRSTLLEESHELLDALDGGDSTKISEELGDLLHQFVFHCQIAAENGTFTADEVVSELTKKIIRRHPHVFADRKLMNTDAVLKQWAAIKANEKTGDQRKSALGNLPKSMPALARAQTIAERATHVGFNWPTVDGVWEKVEEELIELKAACASGDQQRMSDELGDLFFSLVNLSTYLGLRAEDALAQTTERFIERFGHIETRLRENGKSPATYGDVSLDAFTRRWDCAIYHTTSMAELLTRLQGRTVAVTNKVAFDQATLNSAEATDLKLIAVAATGTDIIDKEAAARRNIKVCNVPGYATQSVAQFTLALILELATRASRYGQAVRAGAWQKSPVFTLLDYPSMELRHKTLGIVGYGNIGQTVARMAQAFGMEIIIAGRPGATEPLPQGRVSFEQLLRISDIVTLHCPLTTATRVLLNAQTLKLMRPTSFLINTARGALIDECALIQALREKRIAGAALDVITQEPPAANHPILLAAQELGNLIVTPHTAWSAREARERLLCEVEENILAFQKSHARNLVA